MKSIIDRIVRRKKNGKGEIPIKFIARFLPADPVILEAGAHIGTDTLKMAKYWPHSIIHAFEPVPAVLEELVGRIASFTNVFCYPLALSNTSGETKLFVSGGESNGSSSLLPPKEHLNIHPSVSFDEKISVKTITMDDWARVNNIQKVDFLWLDLQGVELKVLKSGTELLKSVKVIYTEVSLVENYEGGELYSDLRKWLEFKGFRVVREELPWVDMGNVLFVRN
jgi:FkbM family methyltransferase